MGLLPGREFLLSRRFLALLNGAQLGGVRAPDVFPALRFQFQRLPVAPVDA